MKDNEKQIDEMASDMDYACTKRDLYPDDAKEIAKRLQFPDEKQQNLYYVALMHDVGKIGISDSILNKAGSLTPEERKIIESHTTIGGEMLKSFTAIPGIAAGALYHHERYDGKGYPSGLAGNAIPLYARIICIADSSPDT